MTTEKSRRLGRGLEALIGAAQPSTGTSAELQRIALTRIRPNPYQPRRVFDPAELADLEASINANGLLQPITVRKKGELFELIAGERRLRAVTNLGWRDVPAIVRDFDDQTLLVMALVENLQRTDLNPIEEARGYQRLLGEFNLTHQPVADAVGKDRTTITNLLRVLTLPEPVQRAVQSEQLTVGHARALLVVDDAESILALAAEAIEKGLSVRETELRARRAQENATGQRTERQVATDVARRDPVVTSIEDDLRRYLQTDVHVDRRRGDRGTVRISFYSADDLDRILDLVLREQRRDF